MILAHASTVISEEANPIHPFDDTVYVKLKTPGPDVIGLKVLLLTVAPEYNPPAGLPPVKLNAAQFAQTGAKLFKVTIGS